MNVSLRHFAGAITLASMLLPVASLSYAGSYQVLPDGVANGGNLSGRVVLDGVVLDGIVLDGAAPAPKVLVVDTDKEHCGKQFSEDLLVSKSGGIKNVVITIEGINAGKDWDLPENFEFDQNGCRFDPHVMLVKPKTAGEIKNSDSVGHNVHTISKGIFSVNKKMSANTSMAVQKAKLRKPGVVRVKCDLHSWMQAWWYVLETPYAALSDADGNFSISNIPPGKYTLKIWHESLGESQQSVEITAAGTTGANIHLKQ